MSVCNVLGTRVLLGGEGAPPAPANEDRRLMPDWMTPGELWQWVRREKARLARERAADARLWSCPEHRRAWEATLGIEQLALRRFPGLRGG